MIPSLPRPASQRYGLAAFVGVFFVFLFVPLVVVAVFALQVVASRWWLARFRYGPMEWLWRAATYLRLPPMRP